MNIRDQLLEAAESYDAAGLDGECGADMCRAAVAALIAAEEMAQAYAQYASRPAADNPDDWQAMQTAYAAFRAATGAS